LADKPEDREPTPEELLDAVRKMRVSDLLLSTAATLAQLGFAKLDESTRDLEQARLAIEAMKALLARWRVPCRRRCCGTSTRWSRTFSLRTLRPSAGPRRPGSNRTASRNRRTNLERFL
jgi:hypothetical protein